MAPRVSPGVEGSDRPRGRDAADDGPPPGAGRGAAPAGGARSLSRRTVLRIGATVGVPALAGCQEQDAPATTSTPATTTRHTSATSTTPTTATTTTAGTTTTGGAPDTVHFDGGGAPALSSAIRTVEENPGTTLDIAPGTYRVDGRLVGGGQPHSHFTLDGVREGTVEGNGARLVLEDPTLGAIGLFNSEALTLRNLTIDYDPLPFTAGTIAAVDRASRTIEVALREGYPTFEDDVLSDPDLPDGRLWGTVHDPDTGNFLAERSGGATTLRFDATERVGTRRYRISGVRPMRGIAPGRLFVVVARWPFKHAILVFNCSRPTLENVTLHASPAFAVLAAVSDAPTFRGVTVRPPPDGDRPIASNADGIHVLNCSTGPTIEHCHVERLNDDGYVVATIMTPIQAVEDERTVRVEPLVGTRIRPGDTLAGVGAGFERLGPLPAVEAVATNQFRLPGDWGRPVRVTFAAPVAGTLAAGDFLQNRSRSNQGFAIRNCVSREVRPRHVRVTSRNGVVAGNELDGCGMPAVMLAGGTFFAPQSPPEAVTVRDNTILRAGLNGFTTPFRGAIEAWINRGGWQPGDRPPGQPIRELTVAGNEIRDAAFRGIQVNDAAAVRIRDNTIAAPNRVGRRGDDYGIGLTNDRDVTLVGNRVRGTSGQLDQFGVQAGTGGVTARSNALTIDGTSVTPEVVEDS